MFKILWILKRQTRKYPYRNIKRWCLCQFHLNQCNQIPMDQLYQNHHQELVNLFYKNIVNMKTLEMLLRHIQKIMILSNNNAIWGSRKQKLMWPPPNNHLDLSRKVTLSCHIRLERKKVKVQRTRKWREMIWMTIKNWIKNWKINMQMQ